MADSKKKKPLSISAFFPCYNDGQIIGEVVTSADQILKSLTDNYEIIVVNDGSRDNSGQVLRNLQRELKRLRVITHRKNRGYGGALQSGFAAAKKDLIFYTDGDGQYNVGELPLLLACLTPDIDVVNGIKIQRQDTTMRIILGNAYKSIVRNLFDLPIYDVDCDFRLIKKTYLDKITLTLSSGAVCVELVTKLHSVGARFREVSVHHYTRKYGHSQFFRLTPLLATFFDLLGLWLNRR